MFNLNDSLYLMAGTFDLFPDAVIVVDQNGLIKNTNLQVESLLGYSNSELIGKDLSILLPIKFRSNHGNFVKHFFENGSIRKMGNGMNLLAIHKNGSEINIDIALSIIDTSKNKYAIAVLRDISDKVKLANEITSIEKIKNELEKFAYVLTHDLKAPLQRVKLLTHLINLELNEKESDEIQTIINYLNDSVQGMERLILGVLNYHKAKLDNSTIEENYLDLNEVLQEVLKLMEVPGNFSIQLKNVLPKIWGNHTMLVQIFMNLIYNSITHNNKEIGIIEISHTDLGSEFELCFADNGSVIPIEHRETIFDISTQLNPNLFKTTHGFGLSIVKELINKSNSRKIWYEPSLIGGSAFKFTWDNKK